MIKKICSLFLTFLVLFSSFSLPILADDIKYGQVDAEIGINVRDGAGTSYNVIGEGIVDKQIVTIYETITSVDENDTCPSHIWYKIKYLQVEQGYGYACSDFVKILDIDDEFEAVLLTFPESYRESLKLLHAIYPNAVFRVYETGLDFNEVISNQNNLGKSLIWDSNNSRDGLKNMDSYDYKTNTFNNNYPGGGKTWYAASKEVISYYVDPRNFLDEKRIFMFESLSYNLMYHNIEGIESILKSSFMFDAYVDGKTEKKFSSVIMEAGIKYGISPYYIASRILQETGPTRSALVLGTYANYPEFNGYYNFYNYGAGGDNVIYNGLSYAYNKKWNSEEFAIIDGAGLIGNNYISVGQDTNYFQKWDVICKSKYSSKWSNCGYYSHQYMQNIEAPYSESLMTYNAYKNNFGNDMYDIGYIFTIPVYKNMPEVTSMPSSLNPINYLSSLVVNNSLLANFDSLKTDYSITIPSYMTSISIEAKSIIDGVKIEGVGTINITGDEQIIPIKVTALNGNTLTYNITVNLNDEYNMTLNDTLNNLKSGIIDENYISGLTSVDIVKDSFAKANSSTVIEIRDANGNVVNDGSLGTGYKINVTVLEETKQFDVIIYGDTNGDSEITILDLLRVQKQLLKSLNMSGSQLKASDINKDGNVTILDLLLVQKHLLGSKYITQ